MFFPNKNSIQAAKLAECGQGDYIILSNTKSVFAHRCQVEGTGSTSLDAQSSLIGRAEQSVLPNRKAVHGA